MLGYQEAVRSISSMFPHIDVQVIKDVLEANSGHIENTVECLLEIDYPTQEFVPFRGETTNSMAEKSLEEQFIAEQIAVSQSLEEAKIVDSVDETIPSHPRNQHPCWVGRSTNEFLSRRKRRGYNNDI